MSSSRSNLHFLPGDPDKEEVEIESSGDISALQRYRWNLWCNTIGNRLDQRSRLLDLEAQLRENTQLEIALREKLQSLSQSTVQNQAESHESSKKTINMEHILGTHYAEFEQKIHVYWILERKWWEVRASMQDGTLTRAMDFWRSQPRWHMHRILVEDCIGMGGCCARGCGCCDKRQSLLVDRRFAAGHCTLKCSCCEKARGYRLAWILKSKARKLNTLESLNARWRRVMRASLVGLVVGSNEDPRELIQPPRYEH
ncbi:hypothetical protein N7541_004147 [Penicillium brevicompactum]|uniref:Uncharacterized protein n=1 Tax=Penicillium brevicompactum TaxID=5074 RepID=A0A9W9RN70_PENBR|nr:hypothetical protein N7541_004147 [Penicillium brevicompactum]